MLAVSFEAGFIFDRVCFALLCFLVVFAEGFGEGFFFSWMELDFFSADIVEIFWPSVLGLDWACLP